MQIDLFLDGVPPRRRSAALFDQLRAAVVDGRLRPGDRLPTSRDLAVEIGIARSTVSAVYSHLVAEGYLDGRTGAGTFVATRHVAHGRPHPRVPTPRVDPSRDRWEIDLRAGRPDPRLFPVDDWRRACIGRLHEAPPGYGDEAGLPELRTAISAWVTRSRGVSATPDQVVVTAGAQGAFELCARALVDPGATVAVENPGYVPARGAFTRAGCRVAPVPVDDEGLVVERVPETAQAIVVTPSHQSPTGALMPTDRRRALLELAGRLDAVVIEDDYDTEYRYVERPLEPLQRMDGADRVVYVGSFSKTVSPSLRLGFVVAPPHLVDRLVDAVRDANGQPPFLTQAALTGFITSGSFDRHLRRTRRAYRARRDHLVALLGELVDDGLIARFSPCHAGLHTMVTLPAEHDADDLAARLRGRGVAVESTSANWASAGHTGLIVGYGLAGEADLSAAMGALRDELTTPTPR